MATYIDTDIDIFNDTTDMFRIHHPHWLELSKRPPLTQGWHFTFAMIGIIVFIGSAVGNSMVILLFIR